MSKTFKSASSERKVRIWEANLGVAVCVEDPIANETTSTQIAPSDAPALALAILEAAGIDDADSGNTSCAVADLETYVAMVERITAEAKEQAELEAEAFELRRAYLEGRAGFDSWNELTDAERDHWLAVARKAREMRTEK